MLMHVLFFRKIFDSDYLNIHPISHNMNVATSIEFVVMQNFDFPTSYKSKTEEVSLLKTV